MESNNELSTFFFENTNQVRIILINGELWFVAKDVCLILGYSNHRDIIKKPCIEKGVSKRYALTKGGRQELILISEGNLYRLVIKSTKSEAQKFESWVCDEILPQIRKTGFYELPNTKSKNEIDLDNLRQWMEKIEERLARLEKRTAFLPNEVEQIVYVMHNPDSKEYKIGRSSDLNQRKIQLQATIPFIKIVMLIPCPDYRYAMAFENFLKYISNH